LIHRANLLTFLFFFSVPGVLSFSKKEVQQQKKTQVLTKYLMKMNNNYKIPCKIITLCFIVNYTYILMERN